MEDVRVVLVEPGQGADAVGAQELVLVEHLREDSTKPLRVDQRQHAPSGHSVVIRSDRMHRRRQFRHPSHTFLDGGHGLRDALSLRLLDHRGGAEGEQPYHRSHLEPRRAAVGQPEEVVVETILLVPHAVRAGPVDPRGDVVEVLHELEDHFSIRRVVRRELERKLQHVLAEQGHPRRAIRLFEVTTRRQRGAAVEHTDVVEAEEPALEYVLAEAILTVDPPGEVQHELVERRPEEIDVRVASQRLLGAMEKERRKGVDRWVHVTEVPLVGWNLTVRVQVGPTEHQFHLLLGEVGIHDRDRERVERQVPGRVPGILPFVGHRDDVPVQHVEPLRIAGTPISVMQRIGLVLVQPVVAVEKKELFAPEHAGESLTHHGSGVATHGRRRDRLVELIGFTKPVGKALVEWLAKGLALLVRHTAGEAQANHARLTGTDRDVVVRGDLGPVVVWIDRVPAGHGRHTR